MPSALDILRPHQYQAPAAVVDDPYFSDEELMQEQEAIGQAGAARGGAYAIPSRESLRKAGQSNLRRLLRMEEAKALPARVAGEYGVREAETKGQHDVLAAILNAQASEGRASRGREEQFGYNRQLAEAAGQRTAARQERGIEAGAARGEASRTGQRQLQTIRDADIRARALEAQGTRQGWLGRLFGRDFTSEAAQIRSGATGNIQIPETENGLPSEEPEMSIEELLQLLGR